MATDMYVSESLFAVGLLVVLMAMVMKSLRPELEVVTVIGLANAVGMVGYALVVIINRFVEGVRLERELEQVRWIRGWRWLERKSVR